SRARLPLKTDLALSRRKPLAGTVGRCRQNRHRICLPGVRGRALHPGRERRDECVGVLGHAERRRTPSSPRARSPARRLLQVAALSSVPISTASSSRLPAWLTSYAISAGTLSTFRAQR